MTTRTQTTSLKQFRISNCLSHFATALLFLAGAQSFAQEGHTYTSEAIENGSRIYVRQCALCHGLGGGLIAGINLSGGRFRNAVTDDDLGRVISQGTAEGRMPPSNLSGADLDGVIAYIRVGFDPESGDVRIGNAANGRKLYEGKGECIDCHRIKGRGPRTAPDLSDIGLTRSPAALQRSLLDPTAALLPINRPVTLVTRDKETIVGRRLNEDTYTVQLIDSEERLRSLVKADLVSYEISDTATHQPTTLSNDEVADLIAYLLALKGEL
ncbi:MAG: c-type cytochrome [Verrucomicrobia bacterium]|nr:c-type cytochrome [Verrucomicrobiota bacterium]